jgi:thiol-disulfide isomerase/thioredoxin
MAPLLLLVITALMITGCVSVETGLSPGQKAPDFELYDLDGNVHKLSDYKGDPVVVNFWATWCGYCRAQMPYLDEIQKEWKEKGLVVLAIDVNESKSRVVEYIESSGYTMTVLLDSASTVSRRFGVTGYPTNYFIDEDGIIQSRIPGAFRDKESMEEFVKKLYE